MRSDTDTDTETETKSYGRRYAIASAAGGIGALLGMGFLTYRPDQSEADSSADGIPDAKKRSAAFNDYITDVFGADQFDGLRTDRRELLIDARYVGESEIRPATKRRMEALFHEHDIALHWLDYPQRYDHDWFRETYGYRVERILWPRMSFYADMVEDRLKNVAVQVIVLPDTDEQLESVYALHRGEDYEGISMGNRCLVHETRSPLSERMLILHEIAHLGLCHDEDPTNFGVMGPNQYEVDLTDEEWKKLRNRLDNVNDTTGFDVLFRQCVRAETRADLAQRLDNTATDISR